MRKFVISDLYGNQKIYELILSYLENISLVEDVFLVINGNLIASDSSFDILTDIQNRMRSGPISIEYLGGKQELRLYQKLLNQNKDSDLLEFIGNLNVYCLFCEAMYYRPILVSSSSPPKMTNIPMKVKDNNSSVFEVVERNLDLLDKNFSTRPFRGILGRKKLNRSPYFFIRGNTPIYNEDGFFYNSYEHYLAVDGRGISFPYHIPLVEIRDNQLIISIFDSDGRIVKNYLLRNDLKELSYMGLGLEEEFIHIKAKQFVKK